MNFREEKRTAKRGDVMQTSGPITHGEVRSLQDDTGGALGLPDLTHMPPFLRHSHSVHYLPTGRTKTNASCCCCCCWSLLYNAIFRSRADSMRPRVILHVWLALYSAFFKYPPKWCTCSAGMAGATWNCCRLGAFSVHHTTIHHVTSCKVCQMHRLGHSVSGRVYVQGYTF